jgi:hypothetical protein
MKCPIHKIPLVCYCPACHGSVTSKAKVKASRANGKLGGRPKGSKSKSKSQSRKGGHDLQAWQVALVQVPVER